jgi:hypothetical protein
VVKARALVEVARYFKWPEPKGAPRPFLITVVGKSPFGSKLDAYARGKTVNYRPIEVHYVMRAPDIPTCDLVFICRSEGRNAGEIMDWVRGKGVVTVADDEDLQYRGIMVNLLIKTGLLKIFMNLQVIQAEKVGVSSQLLGYATLIEHGRPAKGQ